MYKFYIIKVGNKFLTEDYNRGYILSDNIESSMQFLTIEKAKSMIKYLTNNEKKYLNRKKRILEIECKILNEMEV